MPARLTAVLVCVIGGAARRAAAAALRDAPRHRSPNAGWPEAAMAAVLGLRLAGPRVYGGRVVEDAWMGDGRAAAGPGDIDRACGVAWRVWWALLGLTTGSLLLAV